MKRFLTPLVLMALLAGYGCSSDSATSPNSPVCSITAPKNGAVLDLYEDIVIKGSASDSDGSIAKVNLTVNGATIADVAKVPFEYTISAKNLNEGVMKIRLSIEDDGGNVAVNEISVTIQDQSEAPVCSITAPAHGSELNVFAPFLIKGEGEAISGEISKVTLKINDDVISDVTALPFEYNIAASAYPIGAYVISLEVENNREKIAKDIVAITLADLNIAPTCAITSPATGTSYEKEGEIIIRGQGSDADGTIASTVLKINDNVVGSVTAIPFEYILADQYKKPGNVRIVLEVTDNNGKKATNEITVVILGQFREFTDTRDNKTYQTVKIAEQLWFAENLAYLPAVMKPTEVSQDAARYYVYDYDGNDVVTAKATNSYKTRGVLYNWIGAGGSRDSKNEDLPSGIQGPCPAGWHIPSEAEWTILYNYVRTQIPDSEAVKHWDGSWVKNVSGHLRSTDDWPIASDPDFPQLTQGGLDTYGFKIQVTGYVISKMFYKGPNDGGTSCTFWLPHYDAVTYPSNPGGVTTSLSNYKYEIDYMRGTDIQRGYSVRCLED